MKRIIGKTFITIITLFILWPATTVKAIEKPNNQVNLYFFRGEGCPHCAEEEKLLNKLQAKYSNLKIYDYEVWYNAKNQKLLTKAGRLLHKSIAGVPFTVIGEESFVGFLKGSTDKGIENVIKRYSTVSYRDKVGEMLGLVAKTKDNTPAPVKVDKVKQITLPLFGKINPSNFSLPILTIIIGTLDGFNPCSMWVLLFMMSMLISMNARKKVWILGLTFILTSSAMYFMVLAAWLNITIFIGAIIWFKLLIAMAALIGGYFSLKAGLKKKDNGCDVVDVEKKQATFAKVKKFVQQRSLAIAVLGVMLLAISVNLVDLLCSLGLPVVYTQILATQHIATLSYVLYLLLYVFCFMIQDIIVFIVVVTTFKLVGISTKFGKYSHLLGGILMLIIGLILFGNLMAGH